jgi:hypothetical protein
MSYDNEAIIRKAYQAAEDRDVAGWVAAVTEDGTFTDESIPFTYRGPAELGKTVEVYAKAFPDMHRELHSLPFSSEPTAGCRPRDPKRKARGRRPAGRFTPGSGADVEV